MIETIETDKTKKKKTTRRKKNKKKERENAKAHLPYRNKA